MIKATFVIPIHDNDGRGLGDERVCLEQDITCALGGFTRFPTLGGWLSNSKETMHEAGHCYFVSIDDKDEEEAEHKLRVLRALLMTFKAQTLQESIYLDICRSIEVEYI